MDQNSILKILQRTGINTDKVRQAIEQAAPYMDQATSKDAAVGILQRLGVDSGTIRKARKLLDNPLAPVIANMAGVDINSIKRGVDELSGATAAESVNTATTEVHTMTINRLILVPCGAAPVVLDVEMTGIEANPSNISYTVIRIKG